MSAKKIQLIVGKNRCIAGHTCVCENVKNIFGDSEMDVVSVHNGKVYEYEVKISMRDFNNDKKKKKNKYNGVNGDLIPKLNPNYFYYVVPLNLISVSDLPKHAGLYYIDGEDLILIKKAPLISKYQHDIISIKKRVLRYYQERCFLGGCMLTYKNKKAQQKIEEYLKQEEF